MLGATAAEDDGDTDLGLPSSFTGGVTRGTVFADSLAPLAHASTSSHLHQKRGP
jgi:hypothetical protein